MSKPKVSVIIPVYQSEQFLVKCIEGILLQTFEDFELLLINDGSLDQSGIICDKYATSDSRIRVFHTKNEGVSAARNIGLMNARGEWIAFIDSDDWVNERYLQEMYSAVINANILIVQGLIYVLSESGSSQTVDFGDLTVHKKKLISAFSEKKLHKYGYPYSKLYKYSIIQENKIRFDNKISYAEDMIFMLEYILHVDQIIFIAGANYYYQIFTNGLSKKYSSFEVENQTYQKMMQFTGALLERGFSTAQIQDLSEHATSLLLRSLYCLYRTQYTKTHKECIKILQKLSSNEIFLINQNARQAIYPFRIAQLLLVNKYFFCFDVYCRVLFYIHYRIKMVLLQGRMIKYKVTRNIRKYSILL